MSKVRILSRNPLKSGQCFQLETPQFYYLWKPLVSQSRNPLKSGQCFQLGNCIRIGVGIIIVAIPSNRVNVSNGRAETEEEMIIKSKVAIPSNRVNVSNSPFIFHPLRPGRKGRNPLKSGQCFQQRTRATAPSSWGWTVAIPSNRVNVSNLGENQPCLP